MEFIKRLEKRSGGLILKGCAGMSLQVGANGNAEVTLTFPGDYVLAKELKSLHVGIIDGGIGAQLLKEKVPGAFVIGKATRTRYLCRVVFTKDMVDMLPDNLKWDGYVYTCDGRYVDDGWGVVFDFSRFTSKSKN